MLGQRQLMLVFASFYRFVCFCSSIQCFLLFWPEGVSFWSKSHPLSQDETTPKNPHPQVVGLRVTF